MIDKKVNLQPHELFEISVYWLKVCVIMYLSIEVHTSCFLQYVIQQRSMEVVKGKEEEFRTTMRQYVEDTNNSTGALK